MQYTLKHIIKKTVCFALIVLVSMVGIQGIGRVQAEESQIALRIERADGPDGSFLEYPVLDTGDDALLPIVEQINAAIVRNARINEYSMLLPTLQSGGTGLQMTCETVLGQKYLSIVLSAEGRMLTGRPSQVYYPMVFSLETGEQITFSQVFDDCDAAQALIEEVISDEIASQLSTYLSSSSLFPVPFERFTFSGEGQITFYYENDQLSFLSGHSGAVSFRLSEVWDCLDTAKEAPAMDLLNGYRDAAPYWNAFGEAFDLRTAFADWCDLGLMPGLGDLLPAIGDSVEALENRYKITSDSGFYPGGAYLETEDARLRGTLILTDAEESVIRGILSGRVDAYGIETGKTDVAWVVEQLGEPLARLPMDGAAAEIYLVCPGEALIYRLGGEESAMLTVYIDGDGTVQYLKMESQK